MNDTTKCPQCGKPVPESAPGGLCPECMLKVGAAAPTEEVGPNGTVVIQSSPGKPLSVAEIAKYFPQLEIIECLGRGGMGVVYKARHPKLDRFVALKILAPEKEGDPKFADRFEREARALARLSHPNIVGIHDFGETDGLFYLIMEFVDGTNLRRLIQACRIDPEQALAIVPRICEALQYAHGKGVVHRDIKPENVLLAKDGEVKIADFGIAKILQHEEGQPSLTEDGMVGTPHYMAPEQVETPKKVDHRADIYSLGVVFYEMLTGELPLGKFAPPSRKVEMDVRLDEVVLHALEKEPDRRYQTAEQFKTVVETIASTGANDTRSEAAQPAPVGAAAGPPPAKKGVMPWVLGCLGGILLLGLLLVLFLVGAVIYSRATMVPEARRQAVMMQQQAVAEAVTAHQRADTSRDFVAFHPATNGTAVLDAARDFIIEHEWRLLSEGGGSERVTIQALDANGARVAFEERVQADGTARFTVTSEPAAQLSGQEIGSELWHQLGWGDLTSKSVVAVAREFMETVMQGDLAAATALMAPDSPMARMGADQHEVNFRETQTAYESSPDRLVQFTDDLVDGDWAAVRVASPMDSPEHGLFIVLHRTDSKWRIFKVNDAWTDTALETYLDQVRPATAVKSSAAYAPPVTARVQLMESDVVGTVEREKLQVQLKAAEQLLEAVEARYEAGVVPEDDLIVARMKVEVLEARQDGDVARVAEVRLEGARTLLDLLQQQFEAGLIPQSELIAAQTEVQVRELEVQGVEKSRSDAMNMPLTTRVQLMESDPNRRAWRWRVFREPGARMVHGILDVTDPNNPKQLLMGMENNPLTLTSSQDYTLHLDPEVDDWRVEIETAWAGENGGRGAMRERVKAPVDAILSGVHAEPFGELNTDRYHVFWEGELSVRGKVLKRFNFVARLAAADDPVQNILGPNDTARSFDSEAAHGPASASVHTSHVNTSPHRTRLTLIMLPVLLLGLLFLAVALGGATWWIHAGTKTGGALGRAALVLAIGGLPFTVILSVILGNLGVLAAVLFWPLLLVFEIPAFCLGLMSRQSGLGKAAMIVSATFVIISLLFVL